MGDHSNLGAWAYVGCSGFIAIGSNVLMGPRVSLLAEDHNAGSTDQPIKAQGVTRLPITIEDDVWLGAGATVVGGVTIGRGSIVAAGSVVTRDVEPFSVVAGVPAALVRSRLTNPPEAHRAARRRPAAHPADPALLAVLDDLEAVAQDELVATGLRRGRRAPSRRRARRS